MASSAPLDACHVPEGTFGFGANWRRYLGKITFERIASAQRSLTGFLEIDDFKGKTFLDIGCGTGLFSYAAFRLGAERIVSFDRDPLSVECCKDLRQHAGNPKCWEVYGASILDNSFVSRLGTYDIVYAWGSLQHTGQMWEALKASAALVKEGGYLYTAIYNKVHGWLGSNFWLQFKRAYNVLPLSAQFLVDTCAIPIYFAARRLHSNKLIAEVQDYESSRGMYWRTDLSDWLGGLPYEYATAEQVFRFIRTHCEGLSLQNLKTTNSLANNWYLFKRDVSL